MTEEPQGNAAVAGQLERGVRAPWPKRKIVACAPCVSGNDQAQYTHRNTQPEMQMFKVQYKSVLSGQW
jgi:hypothetical protein